jgi:hypothetical protein
MIGFHGLGRRKSGAKLEKTSLPQYVFLLILYNIRLYIYIKKYRSGIKIPGISKMFF